MRKRLLKSTVVLGYLLHLVFAVFFWLWQNFEASVSASLDAQSEMDAMLGNLSTELEKRSAASTWELKHVDEIQKMIPTLSDSHAIADIETGIDITTWGDDETFDALIQVDLLTANNFVRNNGSYAFVDDNALIGKGDVDLSFSDGKFLNDIVLESSSPTRRQSNNGNFFDKHIFVVLPVWAQAFDQNGRPYNKKIIAPKIEDKETFLNWDTYQLVFSVWWSQHLHFKYEDGSPAYADFYVSVDDILSKEDFPVYFSQDGEWRSYLDEAGINSFMWKKFLTFQADHFTYFAIGAEEWSFLINNWDLNTNTTGVMLYNNVQDISQMKFWNSVDEVNSANFEAFSATKNRYLTTWDGTKTVYAIFEDSLWNTGMVSDTIILDTSGAINRDDYETLPVTDGLTLWFDADDSSTLTTWAWGLVSQWNDKSSNNYDAVQSTSTSSPALQQNIIINKPALYFDGNSDYLPMSWWVSFNGTNVMSWMFACSVFRAHSNGNDNDAFLDFDRSEFFGFYYSKQETVWFSYVINWTKYVNKGTTHVNDDIPHIACVSYDNSLVNDTQVIVDGWIEVTVDNTTAGEWIGKAGSTRYGYIWDGSESPSYNGKRNNKYFKGYLGELIFYDEPVSSGDQKKIQCYLSSKWWIDLWFSCEHTPPSASISYNPASLTTRDVLASLSWTNLTILNNSGSADYLFTWNWSFSYLFQDEFGNMENLVATVDWITWSLATWTLSYTTNIFKESVDNDGTIDDIVTLTLSWDIFDTGVADYVVFTNVPSGLTWVVNYISGTQVWISLVWTAVNHAKIDDVSNIIIDFQTWAFIQHNPDGVVWSYITGVEIDYYDPFATGGFYPDADTLLDADTEPANGCDEGVCQKWNYGGLNYMWASDFGSVSLIRFDLTSIPTWSVIVSANLNLTRMDIGGLRGTWFDLTKIINNSGWIEWVGNQAGSAVQQALVGEPNYKQRKRTQENWYNSAPGLVAESDYVATNLLVDASFDTVGEELKKFDFNTAGIDVLQNWLDVPSTNQGFAFGHADKERTIIYSKEEAVMGRRPQLFINYILDIVNPTIRSFNPSDNQTGVVLDTDLTIGFNERVTAVSGYNIVIKRAIDDSIFETINVWSTQVVVDDTTATVTLSSDLENNTAYYVQIGSWAFVDRANNPFTGILDTSTWNFATLDATSVPTVTGAFATGITQTTWTLWWEILATGSSTVSERGIYRDITDGFNPINWVKVSETGNWDTLWSFSLPVTWLPAGLRVYYRAFAINSAGAWYSTQDTFLIKPGDPITYAASSVSNRSAVANWSTVTWADSYELYVATDSWFASLLPNYAPKVGLVSDSYAIESIDPETTYYYRLIAKNNAWFSFASNAIPFTTTYLPFPVMHLKLEETWGSVAVDSAGTHNGILDWSISFAQSWIDNNAYCLDGTDAQITTVDFSYGPDFAIQFWFKDTENIGTEYLFSHGWNLDANSVNVFLDGGASALKTQVNGQTLFTVTGQDYLDLLDGERHMYTLVVDDNFAAGWQKKIALYLDGQPWAVDTSLPAGVYNPIPNITMGRRSMDTTATYFSWCLDDIRIYNQDLFDYEVKDIFDAFVTDVQAPYVVSTVPSSWESDIPVWQTIEVEFSKAMDQASVEAGWVVTISPNVSGISYSRNANTLLIAHDDLAYSTWYTITISTWAKDLSGTAMEAAYLSNFTTQNNIYLEYLPTVFEEANQNDGSIKNEITITLTWDTFSPFVVSSGYVVAMNVPVWLTWVFVRNNATQITFSLTWQAIDHDDIDDIDNLTVSFGDDAFVSYTATWVSSSTKSTLYIDFNDPNSMSFYPIRDTTLDVLNPSYNYGASTVHFIGDWSFVLVDFDLTALPAWATINSATLTLTKLDGVGSDFAIGRLINNSGRVEWTKIATIASDGESTYNQLLHNQIDWFGGSAGLISWTDYDATHLVDTVSFASNETRVFSLNTTGISIVSGRLADPDSNEWFVFYWGTERFEIWAKDNAEESFRPKLLISYTLPPEPQASVNIWIDSWVLYDKTIAVSSEAQIVESQFSGYLRIDDPVGADSGRYTTLSITDLSWSNTIISNTGISIQASGIDLLSGTANAWVVVDVSLANYQTLSGIVTYIKRDVWANGWITWWYGNKPWLKIAIPAYQDVDEYEATITYTLYEN